MKYWAVCTEIHTSSTRVEVAEYDGDPIECTGLRAYFMRAEAEAAAKRIVEADREFRGLVAQSRDPVHLEQATAGWKPLAG